MNGLVLKRPVLPKDLKTDRRIARFLNASVPQNQDRRYCAIGILTVGEEGRMSRPRPIELAVAFDDGTAVSTVINPQRDLGDARRAYGITACDVLLSPSLVEAWGVIAPMLMGCTPVGVGIDETLGLIDFELKRLGYVASMPLGVDVPGELLESEHRHAPAGGTALERAIAVWKALASSGFADSDSTAFNEPEASEMLGGLLVSRNRDVPTPESVHFPALSALLEVSRNLGPVLLGEANAADVRTGVGLGGDAPWTAVARHSVAAQLRTAASRVRLTEESLARLREVERLLGVEIIDASIELAPVGDDITSVLVPGARICFTGTVRDAAGRLLPEGELMEVALAAGLTPVKTVTKTKCDVLVAAAIGSQSGKSRKAHEIGKPVFCADEFLAWVEAKQLPAC